MGQPGYGPPMQQQQPQTIVVEKENSGPGCCKVRLPIHSLMPDLKIGCARFPGLLLGMLGSVGFSSAQSSFIASPINVIFLQLCPRRSV